MKLTVVAGEAPWNPGQTFEARLGGDARFLRELADTLARYKRFKDELVRLRQIADTLDPPPLTAHRSLCT